MTKSLTKGNPWKLILTFALPLLLGNLFQQTYNMADAAIVGQTLGANALAAVGVSSSVQFLVLGFCQGVTTGFAIPVASSFGAEKEKAMRQYVYIGAVLTGIIAIVLTIIVSLLTGTILHLLKAPSEIFTDSYSYLLIIFLGIPCTLLYNYLSAILRAIGDSRTPFYFLAFSSVLNIFLDFFCILNLRWGVAGAAIATVFSQGVSGLLCLHLIHKKFDILHVQKEEKHYDRYMAGKLLNQGLPMGLQFSITAIGSMMMQTANNSLGTVYVSGYAAGLKIKQFAMCPFDALGAAVSTFVSQNYGAGNAKRISEGIKDGEITAVIYGVISGLVLILFGRTISRLFVSEADASAVLDASGQYLRALGWFYPVLGILIISRMSVQGIGWSRMAVFAGAVEMVARSFVSLVLVPRMGFNGICIADQTAWCAASLYILPVLFIAIRHAQHDLKHPRTSA